MDSCNPDNCIIAKELASQLKYLQQKVDIIADAVVGDPSDSTKPGHTIRLDRLERSYIMVKKILGIISGALISIAVIVVAQVILKYWL